MGGMKLDPDRKESVGRQKHSVHKRGAAGWGENSLGERTGGKGDVAAEDGAEQREALPASG